MKFVYKKVRGWASSEVAKFKVFEPESIEEIIQIIRNMKDEFDTLYHYCGANHEENNEN